MVDMAELSIIGLILLADTYATFDGIGISELDQAKMPYEVLQVGQKCHSDWETQL